MRRQAVDPEVRRAKRQNLREQFTNLPNLLTLVRIAIIPVVLMLIDDTDPVRSLVACILFLLASVTDAIDGYLARSRNLITVVGKFLDPLADKLLVMAVLIYLVRIGRVQEWVAVLLIGREIAITGLRAIAATEGLVIAAASWGKNKTAFQLVGISFLILHFPFPLLGTNVVIDFHVVGINVIFISLFFSIFSAVQYFKYFLNAADQGRQRSGDPPAAGPSAPKSPSGTDPAF
jgi:CDP-diacylglycerol---glycerol-3-phosphate 3-phosphatidyltransferase